MLDISDKADNTAGSTGELTAAEFNDHKNCLQDSIEYSGQVLSQIKTPDQLGRAMFINGVAGQTFSDSAPGANSIQLTPLTGNNGLRMTDDYPTLDGAIIEFNKPTANTSTSVIVNIGQTSGALLGAKNLKKYDGTNPAVGEVKGYLRIQWDNTNDYWVIIPDNVSSLVETHEADYSLTSNDANKLIIGSCNTATQYGTLNFELPLGSASILGLKFRIRHDANEGLIRIYVNGAGSNKINYRGNALDEFFIFDDGQELEFEWNGSDFSMKGTISEDYGTINCSDWSNRALTDSSFDYDNKSAAVDLTGMVITEATSNNTWIVAEDTGGTGATGTFKVYKATGTGFATDGRVVTASDGTTVDVDEGTGDNKNQDGVFNTLMPIGIGEFNQECHWDDAADMTSAHPMSFSNDVSSRGLDRSQVSTTSYSIHGSSTTIIRFVSYPGLNTGTLTTEDYYYRIINVYHT